MQVNAFGLGVKSGESASRFGRLLILIVKSLVGGLRCGLSKSLLLIVKERLRLWEERSFCFSLSFAGLLTEISLWTKTPSGEWKRVTTFAADVPFLISRGLELTARSPLRDDDLSEGLCYSSLPFLGCWLWVDTPSTLNLPDPQSFLRKAHRGLVRRRSEPFSSARYV